VFASMCGCWRELALVREADRYKGAFKRQCNVASFFEADTQADFEAGTHSHCHGINILWRKPRVAQRLLDYLLNGLLMRIARQSGHYTAPFSVQLVLSSLGFPENGAVAVYDSRSCVVAARLDAQHAEVALPLHCHLGLRRRALGVGRLAPAVFGEPLGLAHLGIARR